MKLATFIFISAFLAIAAGTPWIAEPRTDQYWVDMHNSFINNTLNNPGINVLFYGDSITDSWRYVGLPIFNQYYAPLGAANYGISGDRTEHVLFRMRDREISGGMNPKVCVIKIGTNNIGEDINSIALGVIFDVLELRERLPNTKILLLGILPRTDEGWTRKTSAVNEVLKHLDNGSTIRFLDMKDHFYYGGENFDRELYDPDLLHLSFAGYQKWAEVMDPLFREMFNSN